MSTFKLKRRDEKMGKKKQSKSLNFKFCWLDKCLRWVSLVAMATMTVMRYNRNWMGGYLSTHSKSVRLFLLNNLWLLVLLPVAVWELFWYVNGWEMWWQKSLKTPTGAHRRKILDTKIKWMSPKLTLLNIDLLTDRRSGRTHYERWREIHVRTGKMYLNNVAVKMKFEHQTTATKNFCHLSQFRFSLSISPFSVRLTFLYRIQTKANIDTFHCREKVLRSLLRFVRLD